VALQVIDFIKRWKGTELKERSSAQSHFNDLCDVFGQPHPTDADQVGSFYCFEKRVTKSDNTIGFADVWKARQFGWEYKKRGESLSHAYKQLLDYRDSLENPPLLVVCDTETFEVHTNFNNTAKHVYRFRIEDLASSETLPDSPLTALEVLGAAFTNVDLLRSDSPPSKAELDFHKHQLADVQSRVPKLGLVIVSEGAPLDKPTFPIRILRIEPEEVEAAYEAEAIATKPKFPPLGDFSPIVMTSLFEPSESEKKAYIRKRNSYLAKFRKFLEDLVHWAQLTDRACKIDMAVVNEGITAASDVIVQVLLPTTYGVPECDEDELIPKPIEPYRPPQPPALPIISTSIPYALHSPDVMTSQRNLNLPLHRRSPEITERPEYTLVEWRSELIQSQYSLQLTPMVVLFPPNEGMQQHAFEYKLFAANMPVASGTLRVSTIGVVKDVSIVDLQKAYLEESAYHPEDEDNADDES
jgi:hypothetical protein